MWRIAEIRCEMWHLSNRNSSEVLIGSEETEVQVTAVCIILPHSWLSGFRVMDRWSKAILQAIAHGVYSMPIGRFANSKSSMRQ